MKLPMKRDEMDVYFCKHAIEQYKKRMADIDSSPMDAVEPADVSKYDWVKNDPLEREMKRRGAFFVAGNPKNECVDFACSVNNMKIYKGFLGKNNGVYVVTAYAFKQQFRRWFVQPEKIEFEDE